MQLWQVSPSVHAAPQPPQVASWLVLSTQAPPQQMSFAPPQLTPFAVGA
jgi:hypothetical protein